MQELGFGNFERLCQIKIDNFQNSITIYVKELELINFSSKNKCRWKSIYWCQSKIERFKQQFIQIFDQVNYSWTMFIWLDLIKDDQTIQIHSYFSEYISNS